MAAKTQGDIIYLNGANGSGKTTVSKILQRKLPQPFLHIPFDSFISMLPPGNNIEVFRKMARGFLYAMHSMLEEGNNLIIDHVLIQDRWLNRSVRIFSDVHVVFVNIYCPLNILEDREAQKYGAVKGIAKSQYDKVYSHKTFDLQCDSSKESPEDIADSINLYYREEEPLAFSLLANELEDQDL